MKISAEMQGFLYDQFGHIRNGRASFPSERGAIEAALELMEKYGTKTEIQGYVFEWIGENGSQEFVRAYAKDDRFKRDLYDTGDSRWDFAANEAFCDTVITKAGCTMTIPKYEGTVEP